MGSNVMLDIVGSMVIGGLLLLVALRMDEKATQNTFQSQANLTMQQNLTSLVENIEYDFRQIGYCSNPDAYPDVLPFPYKYVVFGDTSAIWFVTDTRNSGRLDTVKYYMGGPDSLTPNPHDYKFYRQVNNGPAVWSSLGVTQFKLRYLDAIGDSVSVPFTGQSSTQLVEVNLRVEPVALYGDTTYKNVYAVWRQTKLVSKNLQNR